MSEETAPSAPPTDGRRAPWLLALISLLTAIGIGVAFHALPTAPWSAVAGIVCAIAGSVVLWSDRLRGGIEYLAHMFPCIALADSIAHPFRAGSAWYQHIAFMVIAVAAMFALHWRYLRRQRIEQRDRISPPAEDAKS